VRLTGKEYQMLELLSLRKGTTLTKDIFLKGVSCSAREKSQPRNGPGEIFMTDATEMARRTISAANRSHGTGPLTPANTRKNWPPGKTITPVISNT
jgi:hypothetical protein